MKTKQRRILFKVSIFCASQNEAKTEIRNVTKTQLEQKLKDELNFY